MLLGLGIALACGTVVTVEASSTGITGFSGNPATNSGNHCTFCHSGGIAPVVAITGPTLVSPGSINTYTLAISFGQNIQGGLDVSATSGTLSVNPGDGGTQALNGEITHTLPRSASGFPLRVVWTFDWQAPASPGMATLYGAGNSTNNAQGNNGDASTPTSLQISIAGVAAGTPGESSDPTGLQPLRVTDYNRLSGEISISFESGCETDQNNIYYGPLDQVTSLNWTDEICDIGTSGTAVIQPLGSSLFFVVVGNKGGKDGSYGRSSDSVERPPIVLNTCGEVQDLSDTCTP